MTNEKIKIMEMVKDGIISPEEGIDLIDALGKASAPEVPVEEEETNTGMLAAEMVDEAGNAGTRRGLLDFSRHGQRRHHRHIGREKAYKGRAKWLYIQVNEGDGKNVNIKIPLSLAKFAGKFIPNDAKKQMKEQGIELDLDGILTTLEETGVENLVEVDEGDGKTVKIFTK